MLPQQLAHIHTRAEFDELCRWPFAILFKSSPRCAISFFAERELADYCAGQPDTAVRVIDVVRNRDLSGYAAARTCVRHESPQLIVLRAGEVVATATHDAITARWLRNSF